MLMKLSTIAAIILASSTTVAAFPSCVQSETLAPVISSFDAEVVPDQYFVVFKEGSRAWEYSSWIRELHESDLSARGILHESFDGFEGGIRHVYDMGPFQGLAGRFSPEVLEQIRRHPEDQIVYASDVQKNAPWGLARISHRKKLTAKTKKRYIHDPKGGDGVTVFVIDTGINTAHQEFQGRASWGKTIPYGDSDADGNGHGTHCAGTIGSRAFGVAKSAEVVAIKVLRSNGSGTMSDVVAGVEFAVQSHFALKAKQGGKYKGSVANMSLGGGKSRPLDTAVTNAVKAGLHFAVAAGNDDRDACYYSPANVEAAVTVGASTDQDLRAYFSNHGPCVDIFAPGRDIESAWIGGSNARRTISGTSMASPHVAGLIAYFLALIPENDSAFYSGPLTPKEMKAYLKARATRDALDDIDRRTPNLLIYNGIPNDDYLAW